MSDTATITALQNRCMVLMGERDTANQSADRAIRLASSWQSKSALQADEIKRQAKQIETLKAEKSSLHLDLKKARVAA